VEEAAEVTVTNAVQSAGSLRGILTTSTRKITPKNNLSNNLFLTNIKF